MNNRPKYLDFIFCTFFFSNHVLIFLFPTHFLFGTNFGLFIYLFLLKSYFLIKPTITLSPARNHSSLSSNLAITPSLHNSLKPNHSSINRPKPKPTGTTVACQNPTQISTLQAIIHRKKKPKLSSNLHRKKPLIKKNLWNPNIK